MAKMPMKPTMMKKDDAMKDELFGDELSLPEDVAPESAIDAGLESERGAAPAKMEKSSPDILTTEEEDIIKKAEELKTAKKKAVDAFIKGGMVSEEESPEEGTSADADMATENQEPEHAVMPDMKKMKPGQNFY